MNVLKEKLRQGKKLVGFEIDLCDPCISELAAMAGYDYLWIDTEHTAMDYHTVLMQIIACHSGGSASVVRVPWNEPYLAKRILEMGPDGIIFPMVNNASELKKAMDACMYPPYGARGFGPKRAGAYSAMDTESYLSHISDDFCRFAQIETREAVDDLDNMLEVPQVDGFIIGPCDLSGSVGRLGDLFSKENLELVDRVAEKCSKANMPVGVAIGPNDRENLQFWYDRGMQFISAGSDMIAISCVARSQLKTMREIFHD